MKEELINSLEALTTHVNSIKESIDSKTNIRHILKAFGRTGEIRAFLLLLLKEEEKL